MEDFAGDHSFHSDRSNSLTVTLPNLIKDPELWKEQFDTIDVLRQMNKFHAEVLLEHIPSFLTFLKLSVENLRSGISKNSLMFCTEFMKNEIHNTNLSKSTIEFIKVVQPSILFKTVYDKSFINKEAKNAIVNSLNTCLIIENLEVLLKDGTMSKLKNNSLIENSFSYLGTFIEKCKPEIFDYEKSDEHQKSLILLTV